MFRLGKIKSVAENFLNQYKTSNPASYAAAQQAVGGLLILDGFTGIDNPFGKKQRNGILGSLGGVVAGVIFLVISGFVMKVSGMNEMTAKTTAEVVAVGTMSVTTDSDGSRSGGTCALTAKYAVDGREYVQSSSSQSNTACSLTVGQSIEISYNPNNPGSWAYDADTAKMFFNIFPIAGVLLIISSLVVFVIRLLSIIFGWKILKSGRELAKTLPPGTDLTAIINQTKQAFTQQLLGMGGGDALSQIIGQTAGVPAAAPAQVQVQPQVAAPVAQAPVQASVSSQPIPAPVVQTPVAPVAPEPQKMSASDESLQSASAVFPDIEPPTVAQAPQNPVVPNTPTVDK